MIYKTTELKPAYFFLLLSVACFIIHFLFFRHSFPPVNIDEASFFSPASSLSNKGILASAIHKSFLPGSASYTYWMPPLYLWLLGGTFQVFGATVMVAKLLSLALTIGSVLLLVSLAKDKFGKVAAASLLLICPFLIIVSAFIRVEALAIFLTVLAITAVSKKWNVFLLGIIAALGVMTHPLMLACGAGLALTALRRGFKPLLLFSLGFAIALSPYLWYIFQNTELFKEQMSLQFLRKSKAKFLDLNLMYILQSVPMVLVALFCLYKVKTATELRVFLMVSLLLSLLIVLKSNEFNYQVYLVPYAVAAIVLAINYSEAGLLRWGIPALFYSFFLVVLFSKLLKYHFKTDASYNELITHIGGNKSWLGKHIYATGGPDVSTYLLMEGQDVERQIPVPLTLSPTWFARYNYVIEVRDNASPPNPDSLAVTMPWHGWQQQSFTTSDSAYTLTQFSK